MKLRTTRYVDYEKRLPQSGAHILAQQTAETIFVYQAYHPNIANYGLANQQFGGPHFKYSRMSWIKPNFLWMMYRCGWAQKVNQECVLAIEIRKNHFDQILAQAVHSAYKSALYESPEAWKADLAHSNVRLQWDPDHDPFGQKLERRAIQLGLRNEALAQFGREWVVSIQDVTPFVREQAALLRSDFSALRVMEEMVYPVRDVETRRRLLMD